MAIPQSVKPASIRWPLSAYFSTAMRSDETKAEQRQDPYPCWRTRAGTSSNVTEWHYCLFGRHHVSCSGRRSPIACSAPALRWPTQPPSHGKRGPLNRNASYARGSGLWPKAIAGRSTAGRPAMAILEVEPLGRTNIGWVGRQPTEEAREAFVQCGFTILDRPLTDHELLNSRPKPTGRIGSCHIYSTT